MNDRHGETTLFLPATLGLFGYAVVAVLLTIANTTLLSSASSDATGAAIPCALAFGGMIQLVVCTMEWRTRRVVTEQRDDSEAGTTTVFSEPGELSR
ncbi:GPR1/FUN34/YaaH family transporter [Salinisphaera sp. Q1T1-3]|uniref:GPR1/FUN34/YaaH family transporter n=1 Tax=Salinisphaera sp. Q1T1-3 TaxID=2321229 RepID=UPI000E7138F5|nr:GPR1/FUN34/YaaH family transporter [Salinisphaera sp. Q1T1-3]RJS95223.1 hypothetical protein D3260_01310 [Salinisphaera sp. Q1T1-3]